MHAYDVAFNNGGGLRPGSIADANDQAQLGEIEVQDEFTRRAWSKGVKTLDRQKLDVVSHTRSNIFGWRSQFTP